ncbi:MAG TPA: SPFH domain-containing protein [Acidobacteriota bacterium]|nr:SPFH domain-containing protein [Acidobacteriota bacterium]HQO20858.1 SPFH domain-containing protein [Acidobacteriota bacterium]HQQ47692.1 SPFH domain-containing protein [Acidobacteriota bacterium]
METGHAALIGGLMVPVVGFLAFVILVVVLKSFKSIGPTEIGLVNKRLSFKKLANDNPIAFNGEPGYQEELLMPGLRFKLWPIYVIEKHPWVQVPAGEIGVVIAQVGQPLPIGAKSAVYKNEFGNFSSLRWFIQQGGQKGVQRPVLCPGSLIPIHPVGFLVITKKQVYGVPVAPEIRDLMEKRGGILTPDSFGLRPDQLNVVCVEPRHDDTGRAIDVVGIVTVNDGDPLSAGDIASRLGGFEDIKKLESDKNTSDMTLMETILENKNTVHNNYQDFQAFIDNGGRIGLQHDPLLYGTFNLNPFLVNVEIAPMLVIEQGQVAVIKSYVGLPSQDTSGQDFKFGSIVRPGHRGIWREALRTGKYPLNSHCYKAEIVPTAILNLNWADAASQAHNLDQNLKQIVAKSREGFVFRIDLQVQIHIPDTQASKVISMVGSVRNLVNEVLQAAVGNHFRDKLQSMPAILFIEKRNEIQMAATEYIEAKLKDYVVETRGVYIQDVILPEELVQVLTQREIANQEIQTYKKKEEAQQQRILTERAQGTADMQAELSKSTVNVDIRKNEAQQIKIQAEAYQFKKEAEGRGDSFYVSETGKAKGAEIEAVGMARAKAADELRKALGEKGTTTVNVIDALMKGDKKIMPEILVAGGGGAVEGLAASLMKFLSDKTADTKRA